MKKPKSPLSIIYVKWTDACGATGSWVTIAEIEEQPLECWTAGFLIHSTKKSVTIAATIALGHDGQPEQANSEFVVPMSCIDKIIELPVDGSDARVLYARRAKKPEKSKATG